METLVEMVEWRRRRGRSAFVGSLLSGDAGIRLLGRDPESGIDVALSIPRAQVTSVNVTQQGNRDPDVVVELDDGEPIYLHAVGRVPLHAHLLARRLDALLRPG